MNINFSLRSWYLIQLLIIAGLIGFVLFLQHRLGLEPCPLCILQRVVFFGLAGVLLIAFLHGPKDWGRWVYGLAGGLVSVIGVGVSGWHLRLQNLPADQVPACGPGLDFMMENFPLADAAQMIFQGSGECAEQLWSFLGLSMPAWALVWFLLLGIGAILPLVPKWRRWVLSGN
ncbi:MAG: disulfide bond formation protein B [Gammaproteobacteria bacterium]|nr:MAG: disulfide bond formation protein B [Gammaproteobacteria bacterium]RLA11873.1 MAG: disulfide bond formation protein B [Gammaproteobacteria bacterium]RLA15599.1 MAG: disulfide bond formation protein B [Gammaproteobacteria bacterium]